MSTQEDEKKPKVEKPKGPETPEQAAARASGVVQAGKEKSAAAALAGAENTQEETPLASVEGARKKYEERQRQEQLKREERHMLEKAGEAFQGWPQLELMKRIAEGAYDKDDAKVGKEMEKILTQFKISAEKGGGNLEAEKVKDTLDDFLSQHSSKVWKTVENRQINTFDDKERALFEDVGVPAYLEERVKEFDEKIIKAEASMARAREENKGVDIHYNAYKEERTRYEMSRRGVQITLDRLVAGKQNKSGGKKKAA